MTVQNVKVEAKTIGGSTITADDSVKPGQGTAAYTALQNHRDVVVASDTEIKIAPFHAIDFATITMSAMTLPDPPDDVCP